MLVGTYKNGQTATSTVPKSVAILGGGIAGAAIASGLRQVGISHVLIEQGASLAGAASGNPLGLQSPRLRVDNHPISRLSISAFSRACDIAIAAGAVISKGTVALDIPERELERHRKLAQQGWPRDLFEMLDLDGVEKFTGIELGIGGIYYPRAQVISPVQLTHHLAEGSDMIVGDALSSLSRVPDGWKIEFESTSDIIVSHLVLAAGSDLPDLLEMLDCPPLPLQVTSGQLSYFPQDNRMRGLKIALHYGGYIAADRDGYFIAGASFDKDASSYNYQLFRSKNWILKSMTL